MKKLLMAALIALAPLAALAAAEPTLADPVAQRRLVDLSAQLRCLVCQNQSIAESNAELAVDLRNQINEQIKAGKFVLYRPPFKATTVLLWVGPLALLLIGVFTLFRTLKARRARVDDRPLTEAEHAEAKRLLESVHNKSAS